MEAEACVPTGPFSHPISDAMPHTPATPTKCPMTGLSNLSATTVLQSTAPGHQAAPFYPIATTAATEAADISSEATNAATAMISSETSHIPPWLQRRPDAASCPKLTRRQLRLAGLTYTLKEVAQHRYVDDAWIAVNGSVYDITEHLITHPGWGATAADSTVLSILAHSGSECSEEFTTIHRPYPIAWRQLKAFYIGELNPVDIDH